MPSPDQPFILVRGTHHTNQFSESNIRIMSNRYDTNGRPEGEFQPGSNGRVLINKLGISDVEEMDNIELDLLDKLYEAVTYEIEIDQVITAADVVEWHRKWLGNVYEWAGKERSVNVSKGNFPFAAAHQIPRLLKKLDTNYLGQFTPCNDMSDEQLVNAIAIVHIEFVLIHPFRDGNGRIARLLANVMALQADKPELDFSSWDADRDSYFSAIQAGMDGNYEPMKALVRQALLDGEKGANV